MSRILKDFRIDEISAVDEPAQRGARAVIMKSRTPSPAIDPHAIRKIMSELADPDEAVDLIESEVYSKAYAEMMPGETVEAAVARTIDPRTYEAHSIAKRRQIAKANGRPY